MLILVADLPPDSSALPVLPGLSADQPEGENGLTNIEIPANIEANEDASEEDAPLLTDRQFAKRRK